MTEEVAALVLRNNYLQSQALQYAGAASGRAAAASTAPDPRARAFRRPQPRARVPADRRASSTERRKSGRGLTRPELAILLAYSKIWLQQPPARLRRAGGSVPVGRTGRATSRRAVAGALPARHQPAPAAPRDHRHGDHQQPGQPHGADVRAARAGRHRRRAARRSRAPTPRRARSSPCATCGREIEALDNKVDREAAVRGDLPDQPPAAPRDLLAAERARSKLQVDAAVSRVPRRRASPRGGDRRRCSRGAELERFEEGRKRYLEAAGCRRRWRRASRASRRSMPRSTSWRSRAVTRLRVAETARIYFEVGTRVGFDWLRAQIEKLTVDGPLAGDRAHRRCATPRCAAAPPAPSGVLARKDASAARRRASPPGSRSARGKDLRALAAHARRHARRRRRATSRRCTVGVQSRSRKLPPRASTTWPHGGQTRPCPAN